MANPTALTKLDPGVCTFCNERTDRFAGDPGLWPLEFTHPDGTGYVRQHHVKCVQERLFPQAPHPSSNPETNRDKVLRGEAVEVSEGRLREMQEQAIRLEGVPTHVPTYHWHWAAVINELIERRVEVQKYKAWASSCDENFLQVHHNCIHAREVADKALALLSEVDAMPVAWQKRRTEVAVLAQTVPPLHSETSDERECALQDIAYRNGAQQALAIAHQDLKAADKWLADLWERSKEARRALKSNRDETGSHT